MKAAIQAWATWCASTQTKRQILRRGSLRCTFIELRGLFRVLSRLSVVLHSAYLVCFSVRTKLRKSSFGARHRMEIAPGCTANLCSVRWLNLIELHGTSAWSPTSQASASAEVSDLHKSRMNQGTYSLDGLSRQELSSHRRSVRNFSRRRDLAFLACPL